MSEFRAIEPTDEPSRDVGRGDPGVFVLSVDDVLASPGPAALSGGPQQFGRVDGAFWTTPSGLVSWCCRAHRPVQRPASMTAADVWWAARH